MNERRSFIDGLYPKCAFELELGSACRLLLGIAPPFTGKVFFDISLPLIEVCDTKWIITHDDLRLDIVAPTTAQRPSM